MLLINDDLRHRCHRNHRHLMAREPFANVVYHRCPRFVPPYFASLNLAPKKIQYVRYLFVWCGIGRGVIRIRIYFTLGSHCTIFEGVGSLIFSLTSVQSTKILQSCRHRGRIYFGCFVPASVFPIRSVFAVSKLVLLTFLRNLLSS